MAEIIALLANQVVTAVLLTYIFILWVALILWASADIRSRTENPWLRLLSILIVGVGWVFGFVLYLILRPSTSIEEDKQRLLEERAIESQTRSIFCPNCSEVVREDFLFCASCGQAVKKSCFSCQKLIEISWNQCAYCGVSTGARALPVVKEVPTLPKPRNFWSVFLKKIFSQPASDGQVKRGPGRPRKVAAVASSEIIKRGRGRPRKDENAQQTGPKRGRGRSRKTPIAVA